MGEPLRHAGRGARAAEGARAADALGGRAADLVPRALSGLDAFRAAIEEHELVAPALDSAALARARDALDRAGLLLVGEAHGVLETPSVLYSLARALEARGVGFEWSHEEVGGAMAQFLATGRLDLGALWALGPDSDFLAGDGRVTAGHFSLLRRLREEGRLDQVVLFDRPDTNLPGAADTRERELAERLLSGWRRDVRLLAVAGAAHVLAAAPGVTPMGAHVARAVPGVATVTIAYAGGRCWFHGVRELDPLPAAGGIVIPGGKAHPAVVPRK